MNPYLYSALFSGLKGEYILLGQRLVNSYFILHGQNVQVTLDYDTQPPHPAEVVLLCGS